MMTTLKEFLDIVKSDKESNLISVHRARKAIAEMPEPPTPEQMEIIEKAKKLGMLHPKKSNCGYGSSNDGKSIFWELHHSWRSYKEFMDRQIVADALGFSVDDFITNPAYWYEDAKQEKEEKEKKTRGRSSFSDEEPDYLIINEHSEWILASREEKARQGYKFSIPVDELITLLERKELI